MSYGAELADPIIDIRDVVETFRGYGLLTSDWREALRGAIDTLDGLPDDARSASGATLLVPRLHRLLETGLKQGDPVVDEVADHVATLLDQRRIPGISSPDTDRWEFD